MKEVDRKKIPKNNQKKSSAKSEKRDHNLQVKSGRKAMKAEETEVKASSGILVSESSSDTGTSEANENMVIDFVVNVSRSDEASPDLKLLKMVGKDISAKSSDDPRDGENEPKEDREEESDADTVDDSEMNSESSQGDAALADDEKVERGSRVPKTLAKDDPSGGNSQSEIVKSDQKLNNVRVKTSKSTLKISVNPSKEPSKGPGENISADLRNMKIYPNPSSESSEEVVDNPLEEAKDVDVQDETSGSANSVESDDETGNADENGENEASVRKIQEMELRIEKLEEELREVAALEVALYSVVPDHGSSAHKVHTPARRLCRLYVHACKLWSPDKRATVARNTVSGLVLIAKSCGHDVPRLTFWLSNVVVLREIISQTFGSSCQSSPLTRIFESNGGGKNIDAKLSSLKWKSNSGSKQLNKQGFMQLVDDWQETRTFIAALEKVESWIFSRMAESIWWQTLTPNMQSTNDDKSNNKVLGRILGPPLGDQQQGSFSINLWKNAFQDAFKRLCPVRAGGHECGCLPVLARKVMEQCLARLDVAMFNAILRESAHEIPTDPVSDPIVDSKVLPIPAGDLSFGSGAQLKNSVGNWSRWLSDLFGMDAAESIKEDQNNCEDGGEGGGDEPKCFYLLSSLSDLLMLPKDMLMDRTIRMEVCPKISLPLVKRILCNFTPDEFCPDPVPGVVLEALNAECIIERRLSGDSACSFPYPAAPIIYTAPSSAEVAEKVAEAGGKSQLSRSASAIQRKGYTSDEDLVELDCPLETIVDKSPSSPTNLANANGNQKQEETGYVGANARYELLREVWLAT